MTPDQSEALRKALLNALVVYGECAFCGRDGITPCKCEGRDPLQGAVLEVCQTAFGGREWWRGKKG